VKDSTTFDILIETETNDNSSTPGLRELCVDDGIPEEDGGQVASVSIDWTVVQPNDEGIRGFKSLVEECLHFSTKFQVDEDSEYQGSDEVGVLTAISAPKLWVKSVAVALGNMTEVTDAGFGVVA
jgi:hypothetical protein